jgi:hypothetical protein
MVVTEADPEQRIVKELNAEAQRDAGGALIRIDETLALAGETGEH